MRKIYISVIVVFCLHIISAYTQNLNGTWKGTLFQEPKTNFYFEIKIKKTEGNKIYGTTYIQNAGEAMQFGSKKGDYGTLEFSGTINGNDVIIQESGIVQQDKSSSFYWCIKKCLLKLTKENNNWTLSGSWHSTGTCKPGTLTVTKKIKSPKKESFNKTQNNNPEPNDSLANINPIKPILPMDSVKESHQIQADTSAHRKVDVKYKLNVDNTELQLKIWDNDLVDGDIISLQLNGNWILKEHTVTKGKKKLKIRLTQKVNTLVLYAENLGSKPPNTAAIMVYDGKIEHKIILQSDKGKSEAISITKNE